MGCQVHLVVFYEQFLFVVVSGPDMAEDMDSADTQVGDVDSSLNALFPNQARNRHGNNTRKCTDK